MEGKRKIIITDVSGGRGVINAYNDTWIGTARTGKEL